jgi:HNH endonuclease
MEQNRNDSRGESMQGEDDLERYFYIREINGIPHKLARMRVTKKGHDLIFTGEIDPISNRPTKYATGDTVEGLAENLLLYEERGLVIRLPPPTLPTREGRSAEALAEADRGGPPPGTRPDLFLVERSKSRNAISGEGPTSTRDEEAIARLAKRSHRDPTTGCLIWNGTKAKGGYGQITYRRTVWSVHRLSWTAHRGEIPPHTYICHACDNPSCIAIEHLFIGSPRENYFDMRKKGRSRFNAKLTLENVADIKRRLARGEPIRDIAKDFTVNAIQIKRIQQGISWTDIDPRAP